MAAEIIEGSIAATEPVRSKRGYCLFDPLVVTDKSGKSRELRKVSAGGEVATAITPRRQGAVLSRQKCGDSGYSRLAPRGRHQDLFQIP